MGLKEIGGKILGEYHRWHANIVVEGKLAQMLGSGDVTPGQLDFYAEDTPAQEAALTDAITELLNAMDDPDKMKAWGEKMDQLPIAQKLDFMIRVNRDVRGSLTNIPDKNAEE